MNTLHEIMARDGAGGGYTGRDMSRDMSRDSTMHDSTMSRDSRNSAPSSAFKFRSGMPLDMPMGGYRDGGDYEEDETITKRRRVASHVSNSSYGSSNGSSNGNRTKNVTWEETGRDNEMHHMIQQLLAQNQRMEEKLSRLERLEEKLERMDRVESRLMRVENKMDEILRMCR